MPLSGPGGAGYLKVAAVTGREGRRRSRRRKGGADRRSGVHRTAAGLKKGDRLPPHGSGHPGGGDIPAQAIHLRLHDPSHGECRQLIEDEELRAQIKGSGIGTSATRAEILKKLVNIKYLALNGKTQVITPTLLGELVFDTVNASIRSF